MTSPDQKQTEKRVRFPPDKPSATFPYRIEAPAGEGAMGAVYRAQDLELDRPVALKIIKPSFLYELSDEQRRMVRRRFLQEARAAARLNHPSVVSVFRVGTESGFPFMVMEWLDATSLESWLDDEGTLDLTLAVQVGIQVLNALAVAHEQGIIHRDLKPANIMIASDGRTKLVDFGIARMRDSDLAKTMPGQIMGTPLYASPEQLSAKPLDRRADLYGVSCVLYESLCGQPPYAYDSMMRLLRAHQEEEPVHLAQRVPALPKPFADVIMKGMAKAPDRRFSDARQMVRALTGALPDAYRSGLSESPLPTGPRDTRPPLPEVPSLRLGQGQPQPMLAEYFQSWEGRRIGPITRDNLVRELFDRPLHAEAFCGVVDASGTWLICGDGLIHNAFNPETGYTGDAAIESLAEQLDATLYNLPESLPPEAISILASSIKEKGDDNLLVDSRVTDLVELQHRLQKEEFDGVLRIRNSDGTGLIYFDRGERILDLLGGNWQGRAGEERWENWIHEVSANASIEKRDPRFPAVTFRHQLQSVRLAVERPSSAGDSSIREDAVEEAAAIELVPSKKAERALSRGASTMSHLAHSDPAWELSRYVVAEMALQFERHGRADRWHRMLRALPDIQSVLLHHPHPLEGGGSFAFDAATRDSDDNTRHLLCQVALGTAQSVEDFVMRALSAKRNKRAGSMIDGAILMAPHFEDDALATWMKLQKDSSGGFLRSTLASWTHKEGLFHTSGGPLHILLVESNSDGEHRPMMPA